MHDDTPANEPESLSPFLTTAPAVEALNRLERGLGVRRPFLLVTGQPGTGKSTLTREAVRRWGDRVTTASLTTTRIDSASLPAAMIAAFGGVILPGTPAFTFPERLVETLANATSGGRIALLVVDGADALADDELLELQRLAARAEQRQCPLEILLVGSPALAQRLERESLSALRPDVSVRVTLDLLSPHDTRHYLLQRPTGLGGSVMFSRKACRDIHTAARGRIRDIEAIASESARRAAKANATTISPEHVRVAAQVVRSRKPETSVAATKAAAPANVAQKPAQQASATQKPAAQANATQKAAPQADAAQKATPQANTSQKPATQQGTSQKAAPPRAAQAAAPAAPAPAASTPAPKAVEPPAAEAPASNEPEPVAQGSHVDEEASASAAASTTGDSGEFRPSDDPRVKDWIKRFGGAGVRIGANYAPSSGGGLDFSDDTAGDVRPLGQASPSEASTPLSVVPPAAEQRTSARARWHKDAGVPESAAWPPPRALPRTGVGRGRRGDSTFMWQAATGVLALALVAVLWGQRGLTPRQPVASTAELTPADSTNQQMRPRPRMRRPKQANKRDVSGLVPTEVVQPGAVRFSVAVGTFLDAEMARAERDHLARLVRYRVWVNSSSVGGVRSYRIQFGAFDTREEAEEAAQKLMRQGLIRDASVVDLPPAD